MITIALSKGRIFEETLPLLQAAGITPLEAPERWYGKNVSLADQLYENYLIEIEEEGNAKDDKVQ